MSTEKVISNDGVTRVVETWDGTTLLNTRTEAIPTLQDINLAALRAQAANALAQNTAAQGIANPTNAQVIGQVKALSAQNNALIRIVLGLLDATT